MNASDGARRDRAWAALSANALVLPGLGSILMGRREGWLQALLAVAGFGLTLWWLALFVMDWMSEQAPPLVPLPRMGLALAGVLLFAAGWVWAVSASLADVRRAREAGSRSR